jgi:magnesium-transporting ATPase (P-type)
MSVIIRDTDGKVKIVTKGADSAVLARTAAAKAVTGQLTSSDPNIKAQIYLNQVTMRDIEQYSTEGLRCLLVASAEIEEERFKIWRR